MASPVIDGGKRVALAAVAGAHGITGEVRLKLFSDSIDGLARHKRLFVAGREMAVQSIKGTPKAAIARFEGIADRSAAEALRGSLVEIDRSALPPLEQGEFYHADVIGLPCLDDEGTTIGTVAAIANFGAGDLLEIEKSDGKRTMIPFRAPMTVLEADRVVVDPSFLA